MLLSPMYTWSPILMGKKANRLPLSLYKTIKVFKKHRHGVVSKPYPSSLWKTFCKMVERPRLFRNNSTVRFGYAPSLLVSCILVQWYSGHRGLCFEDYRNINDTMRESCQHHPNPHPTRARVPHTYPHSQLLLCMQSFCTVFLYSDAVQSKQRQTPHQQFSSTHIFSNFK